MCRVPTFATLVFGTVAALAGVSLLSVSALAQTGDAPTRSTRDGVYSPAQASRGDELFKTACFECHSGRLWGSDWDGKTLADAYDFINQFMPEPAPGSLSPQQVRDALAYILSTNGLPAGGGDLPSSYDDMKLIRMQRPAR